MPRSVASAVSLVLVVLCFGAAARAQRPASPAGDISPERRAQVDAVFASFDKDSSPGCAVAVYDGDRIAYRKAYGMANLDHDVRLTPSSVFHVASVSKQFTGAAILLLAADGKLSLDDDIRTHLPELPDFGRKITIRQLANHTSGIRDQWDLLGLAGWRYSRDLITDDDVLELLVRQKDLNFAPGERHMYSNSGFTLMALIVSRVSGKSFREFTTERIFKPLGMTNTRFRDNFAEVVKNQAYGYVPSGESYRLAVTNFDTAGATSLLTTVEDLLAWHANFDTKKVGGDDLQSKLLQRGVLNDGTSIEYAFGITHGRHRGLPTVGHGGADAGYRADFVRFPDRRLGVATLCNTGAVNPAQLSRRVADVFLGDLPAAPSAPAPAPPAGATPPAALPEFKPTLDQLADFAGVYRSDEMDAVFRMSVKDGALRLERSKLRPAILNPVTKDAFRAAPGVFEFTRDAGGRVSGFLLQGNRVKNVKFWKDQSAPRSPEAGAPIDRATKTDVTIPAGDVTLAATLYIPADSKGIAPGAVLGHGSAPSARPMLGFWINTALKSGVAVLAFDKRGTGQSTGTYEPIGVARSPLLLQQQASDIAHAVRWLARQPGIDAARIGLMGGSQAGWTMPLAASQEPLVRFVVVGAGVPLPYGVEIEHERHLNTLRPWPGPRPSLLQVQQADAHVVQNAPEPGFDPAPALEKLSIPVLWIFGLYDHVIPTNLCIDRLGEYQRTGKKNFDVHVFPFANHNFTNVFSNERHDVSTVAGPWLRKMGFVQ